MRNTRSLSGRSPRVTAECVVEDGGSAGGAPPPVEARTAASHAKRRSHDALGAGSLEDCRRGTPRSRGARTGSPLVLVNTSFRARSSRLRSVRTLGFARFQPAAVRVPGIQRLCADAVPATPRVRRGAGLVLPMALLESFDAMPDVHAGSTFGCDVTSSSRLVALRRARDARSRSSGRRQRRASVVVVHEGLRTPAQVSIEHAGRCAPDGVSIEACKPVRDACVECSVPPVASGLRATRLLDSRRRADRNRAMAGRRHPRPLAVPHERIALVRGPRRCRVHRPTASGLNLARQVRRPRATGVLRESGTDGPPLASLQLRTRRADLITARLRHRVRAVLDASPSEFVSETAPS